MVFRREPRQQSFSCHYARREIARQAKWFSRSGVNVGFLVRKEKKLRRKPGKLKSISIVAAVRRGVLKRWELSYHLSHSRLSNIATAEHTTQGTLDTYAAKHTADHCSLRSQAHRRLSCRGELYALVALVTNRSGRSGNTRRLAMY
jgi:hypothetical protein